MNVKRRVAYNTVVQGAGRAVNLFVSLFLVRLLTHYLGVRGYGEYTTIFAFLGFLAISADFGFNTLIVRDLRDEKEKSDLVNNILSLRLILALAVVAVANILAHFFPYTQAVRAGILIASIGVTANLLNQVFVGVLQSKMRMDKVTLGDVAGKILTVALTYWFIRQGYNLSSIIWAFVIGNLLMVSLGFGLARNYLRIRFGFDMKRWRAIFVESIILGFILILGMVHFKVDSIILSVLKPPQDVGIYGVAYKVIEISIIFPQIFMASMFPVLTRLAAERDPRINSAYQRIFDITAIVVWPLSIGGILMARAVMNFLGGADFAVGTHSLQILLVSLLASFISYPIGFALVTYKKYRELITQTIAAVVVNIVINLILIPKYSFTGAAVATLISEFVRLGFGLYYFRRVSDYKVSLKLVPKILLATLIMAGLIFVLQGTSMWVAILTAILVYGMGVVTFKVINIRTVKETLFAKSQEG